MGELYRLHKFSLVSSFVSETSESTALKRTKMKLFTVLAFSLAVELVFGQNPQSQSGSSPFSFNVPPGTNSQVSTNPTSPNLPMMLMMMMATKNTRKNTKDCAIKQSKCLDDFVAARIECLNRVMEIHEDFQETTKECIKIRDFKENIVATMKCYDELNAIGTPEIKNAQMKCEKKWNVKNGHCGTILCKQMCLLSLSEETCQNCKDMFDEK